MAAPLAQLLLTRFRWFDDRLRAALRTQLDIDVTPAQSLLFASLPADGARQADLARALGVSRQAVNELVKGLERSGLVELTGDPTSGRAKLVRPTDRGRRSIDFALRTYAELESTLRSRIGSLSFNVLREVLEVDWGD